MTRVTRRPRTRAQGCVFAPVLPNVIFSRDGDAPYKWLIDIRNAHRAAMPGAGIRGESRMNIQPAIITATVATGVATASIALFGAAFGILIGAGLGALAGLATAALLAPPAPSGSPLDQPSILGA
ncbi:MAG: hypothetical protein JNM90_04830 [Burkholderiales bacterium]|nr:hypothetical protein [Burkholderiales bacterium]